MGKLDKKPSQFKPKDDSEDGESKRSNDDNDASVKKSDQDGNGDDPRRDPKDKGPDDEELKDKEPDDKESDDDEDSDGDSQYVTIADLKALIASKSKGSKPGEGEPAPGETDTGLKSSIVNQKPKVESYFSKRIGSLYERLMK